MIPSFQTRVVIITFSTLASPRDPHPGLPIISVVWGEWRWGIFSMCFLISKAVLEKETKQLIIIKICSKLPNVFGVNRAVHTALRGFPPFKNTSSLHIFSKFFSRYSFSSVNNIAKTVLAKVLIDYCISCGWVLRITNFLRRYLEVGTTQVLLQTSSNLLSYIGATAI